MVDLGVVKVELERGAMGGERSEPRVDEDVEILAEIVSSVDQVPAVTVDEGGEIGREDFLADLHIGAFLEVAEPEVVGMLPAPSLANRLGGDTEFKAGGAGLAEVSVEGRAGEDPAMAISKNAIEGVDGASGLFLLRLNRGGDDLWGHDSGFAAVTPRLACQRVEAAFSVLLELALPRRMGDFLLRPIREEELLLRQLL